MHVTPMHNARYVHASCPPMWPHAPHAPVQVTTAYDTYAFNRIFGALQRFVVQDCSNFYLDVAKDRCERGSSS